MNAPLRFPNIANITETGICRAAVIGAGSMGSGIAAQFANAGVPVDLLDVAGSASPNAPALAGIERQLKVGGFMHPDAAGLVRAGNIDDHFERLAEADWIIEAVVEDLGVKRDLFARIQAVARPDAIVSSNTSTIRRADLVAGLGEDFARRFLITHFFNPPRVMPLVEIVTAAGNDPAIVARARTASQAVLGKTIVACRDTPGFIANRIGCYWLAVAAIEARRQGIRVEEADAVNAAFGVPRTGVFGLLDLIGIDLVPNVWGSLMRVLPETDEIHAVDLPGDPIVKKMLAAGRLGRKAKAGFYRMNGAGGREVIDLASGDYRTEEPVDSSAIPGNGRDAGALLDAPGRLGAYAWSVFSSVVTYAAQHAPEIAEDTGAIDAAMQLGYAWKRGPFALCDQYGAAKTINRLRSDGRPVPVLLAAAAEATFFDGTGRPLASDGTRVAKLASPGLLQSARAAGRQILGNDAAALLDIGNDVACLEIRTKLNCLPPQVFDTIEETLSLGTSRFKALVIGNDDARAFSVGADLTFFVAQMRAGDVASIGTFIERGQKLFLGLKYAPFPVVAAAHGLALGGGCELMLHADAIVAHAELNAGLPEIKVGLVPGWGGCTQMLLRAQRPDFAGPKGPAAAAQAVFDVFFAGNPSTSALDALAKGLLRGGDEIVMNRTQLIAAAKRRATQMAEAGYAPPEAALITVAGASGKRAIVSRIDGERAAGRASDNDLRFAEALAGVLTGGTSGDVMLPVTEAALMELERETLLALVTHPATRERIDHMLATGKPLRN